MSHPDLYTIWSTPSDLWKSILLLDGYLGQMSDHDPRSFAALPTTLARALHRLTLDKDTGELELLGLSTFGKFFAFVEEPLCAVLTDPSSRLQRRHEMLPVARAREIDQRSMRWLAQQPGRTMREKLRSQPRIKAVQRYRNYDTPQNRLARRMCRLVALSRLDYALLPAHKAERLQATLKRSALKEVSDQPPRHANNTLLSHPRYSKLWRGWQLWRRLEDCFDSLHSRDVFDELIAMTVFWSMAAHAVHRFKLACMDMPITMKGLATSACPHALTWMSGETWHELDEVDLAILDAKKMSSGQARILSLRLCRDTRTVQFVYKGEVKGSLSIDQESARKVTSVEQLRMLLVRVKSFFEKEARSVGVFPEPQTVRGSRKATFPLGLCSPERLAICGDPDGGWARIDTLQAYASVSGAPSWPLNAPHLPLTSEELILDANPSWERIHGSELISNARVARGHLVVPDRIDPARRYARDMLSRAIARSTRHIPNSVACAEGMDTTPKHGQLVMVLDLDGELLSITPLYRRAHARDEPHWERRANLAPSERDDEATTRVFKADLYRSLLDDVKEWDAAWLTRAECAHMLANSVDLAQFIDTGEVSFPVYRGGKEHSDAWLTLKCDPRIFKRVRKRWFGKLKSVFEDWKKHHTWRRLSRDGTGQTITLWSGDVFETLCLPGETSRIFPAWMNVRQLPRKTLCEGARRVATRLSAEELVWRDWLPPVYAEVLDREGRPHVSLLSEGGYRPLNSARVASLSLCRNHDMSRVFLWSGDGANVPMDRGVAFPELEESEEVHDVTLTFKWEAGEELDSFAVLSSSPQSTFDRVPPGHSRLPVRLLDGCESLSNDGKRYYKELGRIAADFGDAEARNDYRFIQHMFATFWGSGLVFESMPTELLRIIERLDRARHESNAAKGAYLRYLIVTSHENNPIDGLLTGILSDMRHHRWPRSRDAIFAKQQMWRWDVRALGCALAATRDETMRDEGMALLYELVQSYDASLRNVIFESLSLALMRDPDLVQRLLEPDWLDLLLYLTTRNTRNVMSRFCDTPKNELRSLLSPLENLAFWCVLLDDDDAFVHPRLKVASADLVPIGRMLRRLDSMLCERGTAMRRTTDALRLPDLPDFYQGTSLLHHLQQRMLGPSAWPRLQGSPQ